MRLIRLIMGIAILVQSMIARDIVFGIAGLVFTGMAVFNIGCCGTAGCSTTSKRSEENKKDVTYEEVV
ncbi:hypothetical protein LK994_01380 [Ferruginibacter lapsinanis]|uniref:hypothetical protein n=1 Tax=Ferruginibacter lapsinanis TaxID=563172 RepID=UPI001E58C01E|nr:hypothetical protein [Ferruginibacter lapsinanis]UEG50126.1 hypothetical protein LK994_01380 [Ferruginibacter lapsinanis]